MCGSLPRHRRCSAGSDQVKKLDDKNLLIEIFLIETRVHYELSNVSRAKVLIVNTRAFAANVMVSGVADWSAGSCKRNLLSADVAGGDGCAGRDIVCGKA